MLQNWTLVQKKETSGGGGGGGCDAFQGSFVCGEDVRPEEPPPQRRLRLANKGRGAERPEGAGGVAVSSGQRE